MVHQPHMACEYDDLSIIALKYGQTLFTKIILLQICYFNGRCHSCTKKRVATLVLRYVGDKTSKPALPLVASNEACQNTKIAFLAVENSTELL